MMSTFDVKRKALELLDIQFDTVEESRDDLVKWQERVKGFETSLALKSQTVKELQEGLKTKAESMLFLNELSLFYESHSIRKEIEAILHKILCSLYGESDRRYRFIKKYTKSQHEIKVFKVTKKDGIDYLIPIDSTEGGGRDIVDLIIRILVLKQFPEEKRVLFLDEPIKDLSKDIRDGFFTFLKTLTDTFNIQTNMVTHESEYITLIDNTIKFKAIGNRTEVENGS